MSLPVTVDADELLAVTVDLGQAVVTAAGEVDSCSAPRLVAAVDRAMTAGPWEVTVDLTAVTFLDSAGVHVLAAAYRRSASAGMRLRVLASHRAVIRPLQLTGLWPLLTAEPAPSGTATAI